MATLTLKNKKPAAKTRNADGEKRAPVRGKGVSKPRPTLAQAQAERAEREERYQQAQQQRHERAEPPRGERPPQRIVSLLSSATEILYALGLGERVVAISHECDYPPEATEKPRATVCRIDARASSREIDEQVRRRVEAGLPLYEVDRRLLADLRPDLIVTQAQCDVCAVRYEDVATAVQSLPELRDGLLHTFAVPDPDRWGPDAPPREPESAAPEAQASRRA